MTYWPAHSVATVEDVTFFKPRGPWKTKSDGELDVLFGIPFDLIQNKYFSYEQSELDELSQDIRGLRSYRVSKLKEGATGANEWHKLRNEIVIVSKGSITWTVEDVYGKTSKYTLDAGEAIWTPPYIMHTYTSLVAGTELVVLASTLFIPDDTTTHDTFGRESFDALKKTYISP
jgi:quercetin dioxygenase-like cupin family protein